jgi:hypothetical protein
MATNLFGATSLTGGGSGSLDSIKTAQIGDGDVCFVVRNSTEEFYVYTFDSGNVAAESSPDVILPDDASGTEAWILADMTVDDVTSRGDLSATGTGTITGALTAASLQLGGAGATVTGVLDEDNMATDTATQLATQQSIKAYVDTSVSGVTVSYDVVAGLLMPTTFGWASTSSITLSTARYHHNGTTEQIVKWDSALTYTFGSGGSNADSTNLDASEWHYLYIDDSALSGSTITAARLINVTTAPTWNESELGWYGSATGNLEANDKCIGAFYSNASSQLDKFYQCDNKITWDVETEIVGSVTSSFADKTARAPAFAIDQRIECVAYCSKAGNSGNWYWRHNDQTDSTGHIIGYCFNFGSGDGKFVYTVNNFEPVIDSTQVFEVKAGGSDSTSFINQVAYYLPRGM